MLFTSGHVLAEIVNVVSHRCYSKEPVVTVTTNTCFKFIFRPFLRLYHRQQRVMVTPHHTQCIIPIITLMLSY